MNVKLPSVTSSNQLSFLPYRPSVAAGTLPFRYRVFFGRFSLASFPATGASLLPRHGNGGGLRLNCACVVVGRGVCPEVTSHLDLAKSSSRCLGERAWLHRHR
ncbi:hypothetical protein O9993_05650 [Vibrio lentus]|nr:hypothetical protein [Vibrio lentus]